MKTNQIIIIIINHDIDIDALHRPIREAFCYYNPQGYKNSNELNAVQIVSLLSLPKMHSGHQIMSICIFSLCFEPLSHTIHR